MKRMKRILSILLLLMLLTAIPALAAAEESSQSAVSMWLQSTDNSEGTLRSSIAKYLDSQDYTYIFNEDRQCFTYNISLDSTLGKCEVSIFVSGDGFRVLAYSPICPKKSDAKQLAAAAEYITRVNYNLQLGNFEMDYSDGELRYKTAIKCFDRIPSQKEIEWLVDIPPIMLEKYGDGLSNVLLVGADPAEEVAKAEK